MNAPFLLSPAPKDYLWGGERLKTEYSKKFDETPLAETWECSVHPDGLSYIKGGLFDGLSLRQVLKTHPEFLGTHCAGNGDLPILIKFIDAAKDLSVQVHPDDEYARKFESGQLGKTEMWYVLDASKDAKIIYGLYHDEDVPTIRAALNDGTIEKYLQKVPIKKDDLFFVKAGTIHAIGEGALIAEIQENSNLTYRMYDYDRVDKNGQKRPLHVDKALAVASLDAAPEPRQPLRVLKYRPGVASEFLARCKYFEVYRMLVNTERGQEVFFRADETNYRVLLVIEGNGSISYDDEKIDIAKGQCVFVPADSKEMKLEGKMTMLDVRG